MTVQFEWDDVKALRNLRKHGVSFEEAQTVFEDPLARIDPDPVHSSSESRAIIIGYSDRDRLLLVSFVERNDSIRIINSRAADARERKRHEEENI